MKSTILQINPLVKKGKSIRLVEISNIEKYCIQEERRFFGIRYWKTIISSYNYDFISDFYIEFIRLCKTIYK